MFDRLANIERSSWQRRLIGLVSLLSLLTVFLVACEDSTGPPIASSVRGLEQINHVATGFYARGGALPIPSIDPAGSAYHAPLEGLLIADSEITEVKEVFDSVAATWFLTSTRVDVTKRRRDVSKVDGAEQVRNLESTGIAYCEFDGHVYVTNDDLDLVLRDRELDIYEREYRQQRRRLYGQWVPRCCTHDRGTEWPVEIGTL